MNHPTGLDELIGDRARGRDRDREANALRLDTRLRLTGYQGVDADNLSLEIDQRAARVARVDGCIGLNRVEEKRSSCLALRVAVC